MKVCLKNIHFYVKVQINVKNFEVTGGLSKTFGKIPNKGNKIGHVILSKSQN
jgi:hypothetical protein